MTTIKKQCIGIDCSKEGFDVCYGHMDSELATNLRATGCFNNTPKGISRLIKWAGKQASEDSELIFAVEATGVYHQGLAYELHRQGRPVCVVLPSRASYFGKTLKVRTVTDRTACKALTQMGLEKKLDRWSPPDRLFARLKALTRERKRLKDQITTLKNQRHAARIAVETMQATLQRLTEHLGLCQEQVKQIEKELKRLVASDKHIKQLFDYVCSIDGVGFITAVTVVSEANGFNLVRNVRQLVSYAGYDVIQKQSGSSVNRKPKISKQGNSYIRRALYFPAITAVERSHDLHRFHERLYDRHKIPMKAYTAVQRKLLVLIYTMWTKQQYYDPSYQQKKVEQPKLAAPHELA